MATHNLLTGVGLGNFGTIYPMYQYLGAGDVQQAHNDFLQVLCETGLFGFVFFTGFWVYFVLYGVRRVRAESNPAERWLLAGIFCGVLAFLMHSVVDFNFQNPSLAALALLLAGLFYAASLRGNEAAAPLGWSPVAAITVLLLAGIATGYSNQILKPVRAVGDESQLKARLEAARFIFDRYHSFEGKRPEPIAMPDGMAALLFPDRAMRETLGKLYTRTSPGQEQTRLVQLGEPIPPNSYLVIPDVSQARRLLLEQIPFWIEVTKECDGAYPYDPKTAANIWLWYDLLYTETADAADKLRYADECLAWAKEAVRRGPFQIPYSNLLGRSYWRRGAAEKSVAQLTYYDDGLAEFKRTIGLYPQGLLVYTEYANRCKEYGQQLYAAGDRQRGQALLDESDAMRKKAEEMQAEIARRFEGMNS